MSDATATVAATSTFKFTLTSTTSANANVVVHDFTCTDLPTDPSTQVNLVRAAAELFNDIKRVNAKRVRDGDEDLAVPTFKRTTAAPAPAPATTDDLTTHLADTNMADTVFDADFARLLRVFEDSDETDSEELHFLRTVEFGSGEYSDFMKKIMCWNRVFVEDVIVLVKQWIKMKQFAQFFKSLPLVFDWKNNDDAESDSESDASPSLVVRARDMFKRLRDGHYSPEPADSADESS